MGWGDLVLFDATNLKRCSAHRLMCRMSLHRPSRFELPSSWMDMSNNRQEDDRVSRRF